MARVISHTTTADDVFYLSDLITGTDRFVVRLTTGGHSAQVDSFGNSVAGDDNSCTASVEISWSA